MNRHSYVFTAKLEDLLQYVCERLLQQVVFIFTVLC